MLDLMTKTYVDFVLSCIFSSIYELSEFYFREPRSAVTFLLIEIKSAGTQSINKLSFIHYPLSVTGLSDKLFYHSYRD